MVEERKRDRNRERKTALLISFCLYWEVKRESDMNRCSIAWPRYILVEVRGRYNQKRRPTTETQWGLLQWVYRFSAMDREHSLASFSSFTILALYASSLYVYSGSEPTVGVFWYQDRLDFRLDEAGSNEQSTVSTLFWPKNSRIPLAPFYFHIFNKSLLPTVYYLIIYHTTHSHS